MRWMAVLGVAWTLVACGGDGGGGLRDARTVDAEGGGDPGQAESLFGDAIEPPDGVHLPDGATPDTPPDLPADVAGSDGAGNVDTAPSDAPAEAEAVVPVLWDVLVLTAEKGQLFLNGQFHTVVQKSGDAPFVAIDGVFSRYYTLTADGEGRTDGEPAFVVPSVPAGVTFLDVAASTTATGTYFYSLQSDGQVRNNGGAMLTVAPPAGQAWAALAAEADTFYLATNTGTLYQKNQLYPSVAVPATGADPLVALRVQGGQFFALTQGGKVYKNSVLLNDLSAQAAPPFVGLDVTPQHVYALTRGCTVFEDGTPLYTVAPFTGETCVALATIHSLD